MSAAGWPLRSLFPLAYPLPPLLRLLPKPTRTRFYSSSRLSTSLITPPFRRPINRHTLLSRTYIPNQASHIKPTIEEVQKWDADYLLKWIQQRKPDLLGDDELKKFKEAKISGEAFLMIADNIEFFKKESNLPLGPSLQLARLAREIAGEETAGKKRNVEDAFKTGIKYRPPRPLLSTTGADWKFQPHPELYKTLASNVLSHYDYYKKNKIDKTYIPAYYYLGGAGTGKSRHGTEFASSVQEAIALQPQHPLYHELAQRLKKAFVFHVSFENGTSLTDEEMNNPWNAVGARMVAQLLGQPLGDIDSRYIARPDVVFRLVAQAENVDLYNDFTGILVVDGVQNALTKPGDGKEKSSGFYKLLGQIGGLGLMSRHDSETKKGTLRQAPFILTCVTATCFGPVDGFLAETHRKRVYLPLNRLDPPTWKKDNLPVFDESPVTHLFVSDVGGHARAMELIADELAEYRNGVQPNVAELANNIFSKLKDRYSEALGLLENWTLPMVQCILSRRQISLYDKIPGSNLRWQDVVSRGLIWFEPARADGTLDGRGYLVAPYIWLWMLARVASEENTERLCQFLSTWKFNDYEELLNLETGQGLPGNSTWQSFEVFCCHIRILRSLGFKDGQEVPLELLHSGSKLRDDRKTMVVNRHLDFARATHQYRTDSTRATTFTGQPAGKVDTRDGRTLNTDEQLSNIILNAPCAAAGDFFLRIKTKGKAGRRRIVREAGQCKLTQKKLTQDMYDEGRNKSSGPSDVFMLYTDSEISNDFALPDRSGLVDRSCWRSYFGPFLGRAYMALKYSSPEESKENQS